jgi:hypothetical protein
MNINGFQKEMTRKLQSIMQEVNLQRLGNDRKVTKIFSGNVQIGECKRELMKVNYLIILGSK